MSKCSYCSKFVFSSIASISSHQSGVMNKPFDPDHPFSHFLPYPHTPARAWLC